MVSLNKMWLLPLETKETLKSGKTQMQVGHVNSFGPGHIEDGLLLQFREKKQEETSNTSVAVHLEKIRNHFLYRSDNNAKMRSFAPNRHSIARNALSTRISARL